MTDKMQYVSSIALAAAVSKLKDSDLGFKPVFFAGDKIYSVSKGYGYKFIASGMPMIFTEEETFGFNGICSLVKAMTKKTAWGGKWSVGSGVLTVGRTDFYPETFGRDAKQKLDGEVFGDAEGFFPDAVEGFVLTDTDAKFLSSIKMPEEEKRAFNRLFNVKKRDGGTEFAVTDGNSIVAIYKHGVSVDMPEDSMYPRRLLTLPVKGDREFSMKGIHVFMGSDEGIVMGRGLEGNFPKIHSILYPEKNFKCEIKVSTLSQMIDDAAIVADKEHKATKLKFTDGTVSATTTHDIIGEVRKEYELVSDGTGGEAEIVLDLQRFSGIVNCSKPEDIIELYSKEMGASQPLLAENGEYKVAVMPMNI